MKLRDDLHVSLLHDGDLFGVYSSRGEVIIRFNYGAEKAEVRVMEFGSPYRLSFKRVRRTSRDFKRLGRLLWPLYEKATSDEWPAVQSP